MDNRRTRMAYVVASLISYAAWFEALVFAFFVVSQVTRHARYLDVAWAAGFALVVAGPVVIALGAPAAVLVAVVTWRRRHMTGAARILLETLAITLVTWLPWGTVVIAAMHAVGVGVGRVTISGAPVPAVAAAVVAAALLAIPAAVPALVGAALLHSGMLAEPPGPAW